MFDFAIVHEEQSQTIKNTNDHNCVTIKLYLKNQKDGYVWSMSHSFPTPLKTPYSLKDFKSHIVQQFLDTYK
jgi:hypothetical protein